MRVGLESELDLELQSKLQLQLELGLGVIGATLNRRNRELRNLDADACLVDSTIWTFAE